MNRPDLSTAGESAPVDRDPFARQGLAGEPGADDVYALLESWQAGMERRLEDGLSSIRLTASSLMHEIASEVWRAAGGDKDEVRSQILSELSKDQALRSLIAHSDERFQALAVRTARLEDTLNVLADSVRGVRDQLAESLTAGGSSGAADAAELRAQLAEVTRQMAGALGTLAERDQAIVDAVRARIKEHGELVTQETTRIARAMESYVQHGVEAIGQLAGSMETQIRGTAARDGEIASGFGGAIEDQTRALGEQLQLMYERMALDTSSVNESISHLTERTEERGRAIGEYLHVLHDRVDVAARQSAADLRRVIEDRVIGLAHLVRSDAEALRGELVRTAEAHDERVARELDERLAVLEPAVTERVAQLIEQLAGRMGAETAAQVATRIDDSVSRLAATVDEPLGSLARLIRSDNETIAQQIVADQESSKQALRAMKELQASLPGEVIEMVEQRFASLAESIERSNEMLAARIDRMAQTIGDRHDTDIQVVIDRMGDAMHALASLGRGSGAPGRPEPRIELE